MSYEEIEKEVDYWKKKSLAEFWSDYDIVYDKFVKKVGKETKIQTLKNGIGFIRKRKEPAVLRYFLS